MNIEDIKDFYTINEFAKMMNVHPNTVRRSIKKGKLAAFSFGNSKLTYRIPYMEIERLVRNDLRKVFELLDEKGV